MADTSRVGTNSGHGHVWRRPDGMRARCGGPALCAECALDAAMMAGITVPAQSVVAALADANARIATLTVERKEDAARQGAEIMRQLALIQQQGSEIVRWQGRAETASASLAEARAEIAGLLTLLTEARMWIAPDPSSVAIRTAIGAALSLPHLSPPQQAGTEARAFPVVRYVRHVKRGSREAVVFEDAEMQTGAPVVEGERCVVYVGDDGKAWVRTARQFNDGRFVPEAQQAGTEARPTAQDIYRAAIKWCGEKDRETPLDDVVYFRNNWLALPGLKAYVDREVSIRQQAGTEGGK